MVEGRPPVPGSGTAPRVDEPRGPHPRLRRPAAVGGEVEVAGEPDVSCSRERRGSGGQEQCGDRPLGVAVTTKNKVRLRQVALAEERRGVHGLAWQQIRLTPPQANRMQR